MIRGKPTNTEPLSTAPVATDEAAVDRAGSSISNPDLETLANLAAPPSRRATSPLAASTPRSTASLPTTNSRTQLINATEALSNSRAVSSSGTTTPRGRAPVRDSAEPPLPVRCINPAADVNARLDTQVEVRVYPCNNSQLGKKKFTTFNVKPEGVIIQGNNKTRSGVDLGHAYAAQIGRKLSRYELSDSRACQLLVTTHGKNFWVVPAPEAFSRHSGTCRLLGDRKHPAASHVLQVGDFLRVGSVGVVVIETHDGVENKVLSEERIQKIMKDTTNSNGGFLDLAETDGGTLLLVSNVYTMWFGTMRNGPLTCTVRCCLFLRQKIPMTPLTANGIPVSSPSPVRTRRKLPATAPSATCASMKKIPKKTQ